VKGLSTRKAAIGIRLADVPKSLASPRGRFAVSRSRSLFRLGDDSPPGLYEGETCDCSGQRKIIYPYHTEPELSHKGITPDPKHQQRPTF
jgi:hypothetical protein